MKKLLLPLLLLVTLTSQSQIFVQPTVGLSSRIYPSAIIDGGYIIPNSADYGGIMLGATISHELGFSTSYGAYGGYQFINVGLYAGAAQFNPQNTKEGVVKIYPIAGIVYKYSDGYGIIDLRYQGNTFSLTLGCRLPRLKHNY